MFVRKKDRPKISATHKGQCTEPNVPPWGHSIPAPSTEEAIQQEFGVLQQSIHSVQLWIDQLLYSESSFTGRLDTDLHRVRSSLGDSDDIVHHPFYVPGGLHAMLVYIPSLVDKQVLYEHVLEQAIDHYWRDKIQLVQNKQMVSRFFSESLFAAGQTKVLSTPKDAAKNMFQGMALVLIEGSTNAIAIDVQGGVKRGVQEPTTEAVVRGPREGFTERLNDNLGLLRRRGQDHNLTIRMKTLGTRSQTELAVCYINDIAPSQVVNEVLRRLDQVKVDSLHEGAIEQHITDSIFSPFPLVDITERTDRAWAALAQGQVVIIIDGTPFVIIAPVTLPMLFHSAEDHYIPWMYANLLRAVRIIAVPVSLLLPALYVALVSYHQGMLPVQLALAIASSRVGVPFPAFLEALAMEITFEILREAGVRLPRPVGQAVSIVGGIVIGQAAVQAKIVSQLMVIVVALTAIANFSIPRINISFAFRVLRFAFIGAAAVLGLYGLMLGVIVLMIHLVTLKSFGVPYMSPLAPFNVKAQRDTIFRAPTTTDKTRPEFLGPIDLVNSEIKRDKGW